MASESVTLREYVDVRFESHEKAVDAALAAADKATSKAEMNAEKWREAANEWRGAMSDRDRELPSRREVDTGLAALDARIVILETAGNRSAGRTEGISVSTGMVTGLLGAVLAIVLIVNAGIALISR